MNCPTAARSSIHPASNSWRFSRRIKTCPIEFGGEYSSTDFKPDGEEHLLRHAFAIRDNCVVMPDCISSRSADISVAVGLVRNGPAVWIDLRRVGFRIELLPQSWVGEVLKFFCLWMNP